MIDLASTHYKGLIPRVKGDPCQTLCLFVCSMVTGQALNKICQIYLSESQIEVTRVFVSVTDDFTSKLGISSYLNSKKPISSDHVYDGVILLLNTHTDLFQLIYLDRSKLMTILFWTDLS